MKCVLLLICNTQEELHHRYSENLRVVWLVLFHRDDSCGQQNDDDHGNDNDHRGHYANDQLDVLPAVGTSHEPHFLSKSFECKHTPERKRWGRKERDVQ